MKEKFDLIFNLFSIIAPIFAIMYVVSTQNNYVQQTEYNEVKTQIIKRLDNVEALVVQIVENTKQTSNKTLTTK
jgi:hypothetical protein